MFDGWKEMGGRRHSKNNLQNSDNRKMDSMTLTEGLTICPDQLPKEKRLETLFIKGFVVYLLVMGVMGAYLSSLNVDLSWISMHIVVLLCSLYCASLYYSKLWQNTGYLLFYSQQIPFRSSCAVPVRKLLAALIPCCLTVYCLPPGYIPSLEAYFC